MIIKLPFPPKELNPNKKSNWQKKARFFKAYKTECIWECKAQGLKAMSGPLILSVEFYPPDYRRRDKDNLIAAFKAAQDALSFALGVDDSKFDAQYHISKLKAGGKGFVAVELSEATQ